MRPTYEELLAIVEFLKKENKKQNKEIEKLQKWLREIVDSEKYLQEENKKPGNELCKYVDENTLLGAIPPYMEKKLEETV